MYKLKNTSSTAELKDHFDQKFDTKNPLDHIHGALLALCNPGFDKPKTRDAIEKLVINLSTLKGAGFTNVVHLFQTGLAEGAIAFRPDTPIHANDERRYPGGTLRERGMQPRHFEFGAVGGGMRVVFDLEDLEIYISAHYSFPARLTADPRSAEGDWLLTTQNRLARECSIMEAHSNGETYKTRVEIDRLRGLIKDGKRVGNLHTTLESEESATRMEQVLKLNVSRNKAFAAWLRDPGSQNKKEQIQELYGIYPD